MALTAKRQAFVGEYIVDFNGTQAAIRAGFSKRTAGQAGHRLLKDVEVQKAIGAAIEARNQRTETDADYVLRNLKEIFEADRARLYDDKGKLLPIKNWPIVFRRILKSTRDGEMVLYADPIRVLELIGKHTSVRAFVDQVEASGPGGGPVRLTVRWTNED